MLQAMLAGVASIKAQQTRINVIGNNLANVNTTAYKGSRVTFQDMLAQTIRGAGRPSAALGGTNPMQFGLGVLIAGTDVNNQQGSLNATNRPTDMAIQGNGYFAVGDGTAISYTRDGAFDLDANGDLVHRATGQRVLGWDYVKQGNENSTAPLNAASSLNIPIGRLNAVQVTTKASFAGNLSGYTPVGSDPRTAGGKEDWSTKFNVYDSQGGAHELTLQFFNRQDGAPVGSPAGTASSFQWRVLDSSGTELAQSDGATPEGEPLYFSDTGSLLNPSPVPSSSVTIPTTGGLLNFKVDLDFTKITQLKTGTATNPESGVNLDQQNGFPPGSLSGFSVGPDGVITGLFTNGLTRALGQLSMGIFPNPGGLERTGSNLWRPTDNSGIPVVGTPSTGGRGQISSGFLEQSNVDISNEFTDLIVTQRGFQANTKIVTTVDEMLQDVINMKR